jgi:FtsZ-interacting cell division protein ZipA
MSCRRNQEEELMPTWAWIVIVVIAALIVVGAIAAWTQQRKRAQLKERFGSEYDRTVSERGERRAAEKELADRERKRERLDIVPLSPEAQKKYSASWQEVQGRFVDDPSNAVDEADRLVTDVMRDRGYPIDDFEQRADDISVDHPDVVQNYRAAHSVYTKASDGNGGASTEDLRQGFVHYRALFSELLETREPTAEEAKR